MRVAFAIAIANSFAVMFMGPSLSSLKRPDDIDTESFEIIIMILSPVIIIALKMMMNPKYANMLIYDN